MTRLRQAISAAERNKVEKEFAKFTFFHSFEIFEGVFTPGSMKTDARTILERHKIDEDLTGQNCLDVGCMEGSLAYEFEFRGGDAHALDIHDPNDVAFNLCKKLLKSKVTHEHDSVYNLPELYSKDFFDVVAFRGVYYHLKDPIGALEAIAHVLKPGGKLIISGECLLHQMYNLKGEERDGALVSKSNFSDVPLTVCYPGTIVGVPSSIWYVPNVACLKSWLHGTGFVLDSYRTSDNPTAHLRVAGAARKFQRFDGLAINDKNSSVIEHPVWKWRRDGNGNTKPKAKA